jgi:ribosomal protein S18 acetylase RimI-like enzyme
MDLIPPKWKFKRLVIKDLVITEIDLVQNLYKTSSYISVWDGNGYDPNYIKKSFEEGIMPPRGSKKHFRIQSIQDKESGSTIGFISIYHGYPEDRTIYIAFMCIDKTSQGQGYAQEVVAHLAREAKDRKYKEIRANVSLKNWPALLFWTKAGLNKVNGIYGDKEYEEDKFSDIELTMILYAIH